MVVALVVLALFLERFERIEVDGSYPILPIPDVFFLSAIGIFGAKVALDLLRGRVTLRPLGWKDVALVGFAALLGLLSFLAVLTQPSDVTYGVQVFKTFTHLVVLLAAALLLGHALSNALVAHALRVYFVGAVVVAALAIVQAVDQNLVSLGVADGLDLVSRVGADGFLQPCSIFSEPAYLGYISLGGIMTGLTIVSERNRVAATAGCGVCVAGLLLAAAAGPLAVSALMAGYALVFRRRLFPRAIAPTLVALVAVAAFVWFMTPVSDTVINRAEGISAGLAPGTDSGTDSDASLELRKELNQGSVEIWKTAPVTGVGLGNSRRHFANNPIDVSWAPSDSTVAFNSANAYVNLLAEGGPLGVAALLAALAALWWRSRAAAPRLDEVTRAFIFLLALEFLIINPLIMPPVWYWAAQRLALQDD